MKIMQDNFSESQASNINELEKQKISTQMNSIVSWIDLVGFIGNASSIREWLHETSWVSHASSTVKTSKDPNFRTLVLLLYYSMLCFSIAYHSNLKIQMGKAMCQCCGKVGHSQMRKLSLVQSFISECGVCQPCLEELQHFFSLMWGPHVEIMKKTKSLQRSLVG